MIKAELQSIATAIMFLTRIPVGSLASGSARVLARSTQYFPLVGLIIGALLTLVYLSANIVWSAPISAGLALLASVMLTGAFHEDGLADVADSMGAWSKDKKLEIMRDSRVGTYGAVALIMILLLKYVSIVTIFGEPISPAKELPITNPTLVLATLTLAHVLGRWSSLPLIRFTAYARDDSANKVFADGVTNARLVIATIMMLITAAVCALVLGTMVAVAIVITLLTIFVTRRWYLKSINGITGDCLGATNQLVELTVYLTIAGSMHS